MTTPGETAKFRVPSGYAPRAMAADVLFVLDPIATLDARKDSTYVMVTEAIRRGHRPHGVELSGLSLHGQTPRAFAFPLIGPRTPAAPLEAGAPTWRSLFEFSVVLMRKDPPVDQTFITATWILDRAMPTTPVFNHPAGLRSINEKLAILDFPDLCPRTIISRSMPELRDFLTEVGGTMILKPVYGFGGREILLARRDDPNLATLLEIATGDGSRWTVAQAFIPGAAAGDKRILMVDGEPIGAVLRVAAKGELRSNFHAGGRPELTDLADRDVAICKAVGPMLRDHGQFFVGLDVIGGMLTEINVTSPTGMQEINQLHNLVDEQTMQARFWRALESKLGLVVRS